MRNYFRRLAEGHEHGSAGLAPLLEAASFFYGAGVKTARGRADKKKKKLNYPVISVGNLTWGGTGKTPLVEYLARRIGENNRNVLVLTRGYGKDEVEQMKHNLPRAIIGVGQDRYEVGARLGAAHKPDVAILDDGFQHWGLHRDADIVTINALNPFGNRKLIPAGILREPLTALSRAAIVVISHSNLVPAADLAKLKEEITRLSPKAFIVDAVLEPLFFYRAKKRSRVSLDRLARQKVTTFSAVGSPRSFQVLLSKLEIKPTRNFEFTDHHMFTAQELQEIKDVSHSAAADEIITTEKDFYRMPEKIAEVLNPLILATRLRIAAGEDVLTERLMRLVGVKRG